MTFSPRYKFGLFLVTLVFFLCVSKVSSAIAQAPTNDATPSPATTIAPTPSPSPVVTIDQSLNLTVSPITLVLETDPGVPVTSTVKIRNNGLQREFLQISLSKFQADSTGERPVLQDFTPDETYAQWITFNEPRFSVDPGEWKTIEFVFSPPESAALNYFYVFTFTRQQDIQAQPGETVLSGAPAILVLANVLSPNAKRELQVTKFSIPKLVIEFLPVDFHIRIKNTGNTFLSPAGNIFIDGNGRKDIAILPFNPNASNILPQTERTYVTTWSDGFPMYVMKEENGEPVRDEQGEIEYQLKWDFSKVDKFRIGKYKAHLLLVYDNGQRDVPIESQLSFWVVPWRVLAVAMVVLALILVGLRATLAPIWRKISRR